MAVSTSTRYIVLEWPEGSRSPDVADTSLFTSPYDAEDAARDLQKVASDRNRPAAFTVHAVSMDAEDL
jgi:hypothetical protein